uniref:Uncharacterized protein n=1 Tax=viral metagenome TaxID=1070528 RepID=A0A6C0LL60_9ZZZZ
MTSINKFSGGLAKGYVSNGLVKSPLIAAMIVTAITIMILYNTTTKNITKVFVMASLANTAYLFFHAHCLSKSIEAGKNSQNLVEEFNSASTNIGGDEFKPPSD